MEIMIVALIISLLAAIAVPSYRLARRRAGAKACVNNLRILDAAKEEWAMVNNLAEGSVPGEADIKPYLGREFWPVCPAGGVYTLQPIGVNPTCSINGEHVLP